MRDWVETGRSKVEVKEVVVSELERIEKADSVRVLYAVESGSRAWGFASEDSDWDVRFVYIRPPEWYLSIRPGRDVLEFPLAARLDVSGWDIRKALWLFAKSNPPLLEWLQSPRVYREAGSLAERLRALQIRFFSPRACLHHYLNMAEGNFRTALQDERVHLKKYFYVLRPLLACYWIEAHGSMPPMEFDKLVEDRLSAGPLKQRVWDLIRRKRASEELDQGPREPVLNDFIERGVRHFREDVGRFPRTDPPDIPTLNALFRDTLKEAWGDASIA